MNLDQSYQHTYGFVNLAGAAYDPTTVTVTVTEPDGVQTTYTYGVDSEVVKSATGTYYIIVAGAKPGQYTSRFKGTATGYSDSDERSVNVIDTRTT